MNITSIIFANTMLELVYLVLYASFFTFRLCIGFYFLVLYCYAWSYATWSIAMPLSCELQINSIISLYICIRKYASDPNFFSQFHVHNMCYQIWCRSWRCCQYAGRVRCFRLHHCRAQLTFQEKWSQGVWHPCNICSPSMHGAICYQKVTSLTLGD